ncbi:MAG: hypothetical protein V2B15_11430 [Bacteroidota bacterium]
MQSIVIWYEPRNTTLKSEIEVHLNYWKIPTKTKNSFSRFLDIGLRLFAAKEVGKVFVYFPGVVNKSDFELLYDKISDKDFKLLDTIFNRNLEVLTSVASKFKKAVDTSSKYSFHYFKQDETDYNLSSNYKGTVIEFSIPDNTEDNIYFRFRIKGPSVDNFSLREKPTNSYFESAFTGIEVIDVRLNEVRYQNEQLLTAQVGKGIFIFKKIHLFLMCCSREEIFFSHSPFMGCRQLEDEVWNSYIDITSMKPKEVLLAYHWKKVPDLNKNKEVHDYNVLIKTKFEYNNKLTVLKYLTYIFLIGIGINIASNYIIKVLNSNRSEPKDNTEIVEGKGIINDEPLDSLPNLVKPLPVE